MKMMMLDLRMVNALTKIYDIHIKFTVIGHGVILLCAYINDFSASTSISTMDS